MQTRAKAAHKLRKKLKLKSAFASSQQMNEGETNRPYLGCARETAASTNKKERSRPMLIDHEAIWKVTLATANLRNGCVR